MKRNTHVKITFLVEGSESEGCSLFHRKRDQQSKAKLKVLNFPGE